MNKPGRCPVLSNSSSQRCDRECDTDADCRDAKKCCSAGCESVCVHPSENEAITQAPEEHANTPAYYPGAQAPALESIPEEQVNVIEPEGQVATLRCYATGYPLPTISWKRNAIIVSNETAIETGFCGIVLI